MQAISNGKGQAENGQRRRLDRVSTAPTSCIPMQVANMQASMAQMDNQRGNPKTGSAWLRTDCWNSPLCPRNIPTNGLAPGTLPPSCGAATTASTAAQPLQSASEKGSPTTEVYIQSPASAMPTSPATDPGQTSMKRAQTSNTMTTEIKPDPADESSALLSPQTSAAHTPHTAAAKEKRLPHHVIERRYRENLNSQIESLRTAVPSTSACLTLDMEDIGTAGGASAIRPLSKAGVIAHAAEYMRQLAAQNDDVERMNRELRVTVEALRRLVNCEDCGVVQQIVDAGT